VSLGGDDLAPQAVGLIVVSQDGSHGTLVVDRLPRLDESQQYQLWLIQDGKRVSGAVFSVGEDGYGSVWVSAPEALIQYSQFGVTIEPTGGSPSPTGERVLFGEN
jgi:anti-sigma-K factor RskA